jgi:hypothetical protein
MKHLIRNASWRRLAATASLGTAAILGAALILPSSFVSAHPHPERQAQGFLSHPGNGENHSHGGMEKGFELKEYRFSLGLPMGGRVTDPLTQCHVSFESVQEGQPIISVVGHDRAELYPAYEGFSSVRYEVAGQRFEVSKDAYDAEAEVATITFTYVALGEEASEEALAEEPAMTEE